MSELIGILGTTALRIDGVMTDRWGTPRQRAFLGALALHAGKPMTVSELVDWVWPSDGPLPRRAGATLHNLATKVRKSLGRLPAAATISGRNGKYRLDIDRQAVDYFAFRDLVAQSRRSAVALESSTSALSLWRGHFLEDLRSDRAAAKRAQVTHNELVPAHADRIDALITADRCDEALVHLDDIQSDHPLHMRLVKLRLTLLHLLGRDDDATAYYITTRRELRLAGDDAAADHLRDHQESLRPAQRDVGQGVRFRPRLLPYDNPDFSGRRDLLSALDKAATSADGSPLRGVVLLHGMPGVGKTTLAVRWAHRTRDRFSGGDVFVSLNGFSDGPPVHHEAVVDEILANLGQQLDDAVPARVREVMLRELLADRHTLVVLDNARNTAQVENLVPLLSNCLVLVTSRQELGKLRMLTGARQVEVGPMSTAESIELIAATPCRSSPATVERLAELCGGLPLLIQLAAAHVAKHGDGWVLETSRDPLLDLGDDADGIPSPRTMFDWSYLAQAERDRCLFRRLSLLPGRDFAVDAAVACSGFSAGEVRSGLAVLVSAHLLGQRGARYWFHDLLHDYGVRRMWLDEPGEVDQVRRRLLSHYLELAMHAHHTLYPGHQLFAPVPGDGPAFADPAQARSWFHRERTTVLALIDVARRAGYHGEAWRLAHSVSMFLGRHGFHVDARSVRRAAVAAARADGDPEAEASSISDLGVSHITFGDLDEAHLCFATVKRYADDVGSSVAKVTACYHLGQVELMRGNPRGAVDLLRESLDLAHGMGGHPALGWLHAALGEALHAISRLAEAQMHLRQAQYHAELRGDRSALAKSLALLGMMYHDSGDYQDAASHCGHALTIAEEVADRHMATKVHICLADIHLDNARASAVAHARRAVEIATEHNDVHIRAMALDVLGSALWADGETVEAADAWTSALDLFRRMNDSRRAGVIQVRLDDLPTGIVPRPSPADRPRLNPYRP